MIPTSGQVSETTAKSDLVLQRGGENSGDAGQAEEPLLEESLPKVAEEKPTWLSRLQVPGLTLRRAWLISHLLFAACMFSTFFVYTHQAGSAVVGLLGISWAMTL